MDIDISAGINETLKKYPDMKKVGTVYGNWDGTITQKQVATILPTLPQVDGVLDQGGDGYGAYQAFKAAGRPIPTIIMGNRQDELVLWKQMKESGYKTYSVSSAPGMSTIAFWIAQQVLAGKKVPKCRQRATAGDPGRHTRRLAGGHARRDCGLAPLHQG